MDEEKKYLVIRKNKGKFCTIYGDDANIISSLFGYKILNNNKVGFPESILNKIINILEDKIFALGEVLPNILKSSTNLKNVIPIGESNESSCPLTEYGVLKSLNQIYKVLGNQFIPLSIKRQFNNTEIDPHIPMELFI